MWMPDFVSRAVCAWGKNRLDPFKRGQLNLCLSCHAFPLLVLPCMSDSNMCASPWFLFHVYNLKWCARRCFWKSQRMFDWVHYEFICFSETQEHVKIELGKKNDIFVSVRQTCIILESQHIYVYVCYCFFVFFLHIYVIRFLFSNSQCSLQDPCLVVSHMCWKKNMHLEKTVANKKHCLC